MMRLSVIVYFVVLALVLVSVKSRRITTTVEPPQIQSFSPLVQALTPRGIRVSIPDADGIELFAFHGKINAQIRHLDAGSLSKDILHTTNGRWVFQDNNVQLRSGDIVNYWIFVQRNGLGYRVDGLSKVITTLEPADDTPTQESSTHHHHQSNCETQLNTLNYSVDNNELQATNTPVHNCDCNKDQLTAISTQLNATLMQLKVLNEKMDPINRQVDSLKELLQELTKDMNIGTQLLLVGQQPPQGNPLEAIRNLITDKLELYDLEEKISHAERQNNGILFEMSSSIDKKRILFRAEKRLNNANYKIIDPQDSDSIVGGKYNLDERIAEK